MTVRGLGGTHPLLGRQPVQGAGSRRRAVLGLKSGARSQNPSSRAPPSLSFPVCKLEGGLFGPGLRAPCSFTTRRAALSVCPWASLRATPGLPRAVIAAAS